MKTYDTWNNFYFCLGLFLLNTETWFTFLFLWFSQHFSCWRILHLYSVLYLAELRDNKYTFWVLVSESASVRHSLGTSASGTWLHFTFITVRRYSAGSDAVTASLRLSLPASWQLNSLSSLWQTCIGYQHRLQAQGVRPTRNLYRCCIHDKLQCQLPW